MQKESIGYLLSLIIIGEKVSDEIKDSPVDLDESLELDDIESIDNVMDDLDKTLVDFDQQIELIETNESSEKDISESDASTSNVAMSDESQLADQLESEVIDETGEIDSSMLDQTAEIDESLIQSVAMSDDLTGEIEVPESLEIEDERLESSGPSSTELEVSNDKIESGLDNDLDSENLDIDIKDIDVDLDISLDDFDPLEVSAEDSSEIQFSLPDFKNCEDLSLEIDRLEEFTLEHLQFCLEKINPELFDENGDYVRVKRKITSTIKKLEDDKKEQERLEAERLAKEHEQANNIVSIDSLIQSATSTDLKSPEDKIKKETRPPNKLFKDSFAKIKKLAKFPKLKIKKRKDESTDQINSVASEETDSNFEATKELLNGHFKKVLTSGPFAAGFLIFFEIIKTTVPAVIVGLFVLQVNKKAVTPDILESLVSNDPSRVLIGLELVKSNINSESDKNKYYQLALKKLENQIDTSWNPSSGSDIIKQAMFSLNLKEMSFKDGEFDLGQLIKEKIMVNKKSIRSAYEAFYQTELGQFQSQTKFIGPLREANIFMSNNKCIEALEKFIEASRYNGDSKSVTYGKTLAVNCLSTESGRARVTQKVFELQGRLDANLYLNQRQKRAPASH